MAIILLGLNYRTASVQLRETLTLASTNLWNAMAQQETIHFPAQAISDSYPQELVILSTCNRLEIYAVTRHAEQGGEFLKRSLCQTQGISIEEIEAHLYFKTGQDVVQHLMRVACGLDSMILGEPQILGQVTQALLNAQSSALIGPVLSHLFMRAIHVGKRARTETTISQHTTSISHAAASLIVEKMSNNIQSHVLVVGAGEMAVLAVQALQRFGMQHLAFINRTYQTVERLARQFNTLAFAWHQLKEQLIWADVVISATGAPHPVIYSQYVEEILPLRGQRPLLFVDIAVPRDVEESVNQLPDVICYNIDDLQNTVSEGLAQREAAVPYIETIIQQEMALFANWLYSRQVTPVINDLRCRANEIAQHELEQALNRLPNIDERTEEIIRLLAHRLTNKLLHEPTTRLRTQAALGNGYAYAHAARELFGLNEGHLTEPESSECVYGTASNGTDLQCNLQCLATEAVDRVAY